MASKRRLAAEINVVPYIDVMLVLLVIFMVTAPLLTQGVKVDLPAADAEQMDTKEEPLIVSIKPDGSLYINIGSDKEKEMSRPLSAIQDLVRKIVASKSDTPVLVWGDHRVGYGKVVQLMTQLQQAGVSQVGLVTEPGVVKH